MKTKHLLIAFLFTLIFPMSAFAINKPTYDSIPQRVDASVYTITFHTEPGARITVVGGPADIAPVTDGVGNTRDGVVEVMVGLAQGLKNVFSATASLNGNTSDAINITIYEGPVVDEEEKASSVPQGDSTPPLAPTVDTYQQALSGKEATVKGSTEADANIYARRASTNQLVGSTQADSHGVFTMKVNLEAGKTNRINISAEDAAGNEGASTQIIIQVIAKESTSAVEPEAESATEPTRQANFVDTRDHWAKEYIKTLYESEIVNGKSDTRFDPDEKITRAELTKIAMNAFKYSVPATVNAKPFNDVAKSAWFAPYIEVAKEKGIVQGLADGFHPNDFITRAAALKILFGASKLSTLANIQASFQDVPKGTWFYDYVMSAAAHDIVSGYADATFRPGSPITRAEVTKIVVKMMELTK
ncbi:MAG: S-layer homology domain-containing protein [Candidatus Peregrinibacteria bacterium]